MTPRVPARDPASGQRSVRPENHIERALVWFQRIILAFLLILTIAGRRFGEALALAAVLAIHAGIYWTDTHNWHLHGEEAIPQPNQVRKPAVGVWGLTVADIILGGVAFYVSGNIGGQGSLLGFCLAGIVAARLSLWWSLAVNGLVWLVFTLPYLFPWLGKWPIVARPPVAATEWVMPALVTLIVYLFITLAVSYLVTMESRQSRIGRDASARLRQLTTVYEVSRTITSTLDMEAVLKAVDEIYSS